MNLLYIALESIEHENDFEESQDASEESLCLILIPLISSFSFQRISQDGLTSKKLGIKKKTILLLSLRAKTAVSQNTNRARL